MQQLGIGSRVEHTHFGKGVIVDIGSEFYTIWFKLQNTTKSIGKDFELKVIEATENTQQLNNISLADIELALNNILEQRLHEFQLVPMANKWQNGNLILQPADATLQPKEIPIET
ncbi:MAG TPA: hypothetical protein PLH33_09595, partial [Chitinophagaceae bacterium]|nr:hypothetical protein [Chitinophagaceae bacterium]